MKIGLPKEIKDQEFRVSLTPSSVRILSENNHQILVETGAGIGSGFSDQDYEKAGAKIVSQASEVWDSELIVKVKEPLEQEYPYFQKIRFSLPISI